MAAEELDKLKGDKKIPARIMIKRTLRYVRPEWLSFVIAGILILAYVATDIIFPLFIAQITDNLQSPYISMQTCEALVVEVILLIFLPVMTLLVRWLQPRPTMTM